MLRYLTGSESHGKGLITIVEGFPAGIKINENFINQELRNRQTGFGRGGRMGIETDTIDIISGVHKGISTGAPIGMMIYNKDYVIDLMPPITKPRPGHADLSGYLKYNSQDMREILERSSARETATRVAVGAISKLLLKQLGIETIGHVLSIGGIKAKYEDLPLPKMKTTLASSQLRCIDSSAEKKMMKKIKTIKDEGNTLGGVIEIKIFNVPPGLGSCMHYDKRLDADLSMAVISIPAMKAVSFGDGIDVVNRKGTEAHDQIYYSKAKGYYRKTNYAGGLEGGMSNGSPIILKAFMKPIPTVSIPLSSVNVKTKRKEEAFVERHDYCAVTAASYVVEAMTAFIIAKACIEKFGGDSVKEIKRNYNGYMKQVKAL